MPDYQCKSYVLPRIQAELYTLWKTLRLSSARYEVSDVQSRTEGNHSRQLVCTTVRIPFATPLTGEYHKGKNNNDNNGKAQGLKRGRRWELDKQQPSYVKGRKGEKSLYISLGVLKERKGSAKK